MDAVEGLRGQRLLVAAQSMVGLALLVVALISDVDTLSRLVGAAFVIAVTGLLVTLSTSRRPRRRGVAALVGGIIGVSVGVGIGPVWLVTAGPSMVALISMGALVAGTLLLGFGAWTLVRAAPGWWRPAAIPVAFVLLQFVILPLAGAAYGTHPPRTPLEAPRPTAATVVTFQTPDGVSLTAWYTPPANGAVVILLPGSGGAKGSTVTHAEVLARHGYGTLALDSRGTGDSGGVGNAWGWHGTSDIAGAITWSQTVGDIDPDRIGLLGLSMGGEEAITAAALDERVNAVVAEGVSARVPADLDYLPGDVLGSIQKVEGEVMWAVADLMTSTTRPIPLRDAVALAGRVPVLLIVGNADEERAAAPAFMRSAPSLEVWDLPDTPHIQSLALHPDEWEARIIAFLDQALAR